MASPFSFHCMICFEEFEVDVRYPVVLPCGHTYVCNVCAARLDRCMECRTPLVMTIPRNPSDQSSRGGAPGLAPGRWGGRTSTGHHTMESHAPKTPQEPPIKRRLPLPKNVVLLSLIEATELAAEDVKNASEQLASLTESPVVKSTQSILDPEDSEEAKIKVGTSLAISDCGTYAVSARDGLDIYPSRPSTLQHTGQEESEQDVDTLVRFFHMDQKLDVEKGGFSEHNQGGSKDQAELRLSCGDRVQIVSTEGGWAKLARGYGFVRADGNQLVKVGGSVDRACKLEALLRLLSTRRRQLRAEQMRVNNQFITLMNELQVSLMTDEDLTVIAADTFEKSRKNPIDDIYAEVRDNASSGHRVGSEERAIGEDSSPLKPRPTMVERPLTPPGELIRGFFCAGTDVFDSMMATSGPAIGVRPTPPALPTTTRNPAMMEGFSETFRTSGEAPSPSAANLIPPSLSHPSPSALKAGARAWREMHGRSANAGIDFRTGLSGHMALLSTSAHPHEYLEPGAGVSSFRGMSNHTGLTMWKPARRQLAPPSSLAMPSYSSPQREATSTIGFSTRTPDD